MPLFARRRSSAVCGMAATAWGGMGAGPRAVAARVFSFRVPAERRRGSPWETSCWWLGGVRCGRRVDCVLVDGDKKRHLSGGDGHFERENSSNYPVKHRTREQALGRDERALRLQSCTIARAIVEHLVADRQMAGEHAGAALQLLTQHLDSAKRVEHDDDVLQTAQAKQEKKEGVD